MDLNNKSLTFEQIQLAADRITSHYNAKGFFLAQAIIPKQEIKNGIVIILINEGKLDSKEPYKINKKDLRISEDKVKAYMDESLKGNLLIDSVERGLLNIQSNPGVFAKVNLEPGSEQGSTKIILDMSEGPLVTGSITMDNYGNRYWNATIACCDFAQSGVNDVQYIDGLIDEISNSYNLDKSRIYLFGHSNGHFMSYQYLCTSKFKVAAIAGLAGSMDADPAQCSGKTARVLHIHGDADATISYAGGALFTQSYPSVDEVVKRWSINNQCTAKPENQLDLIAAMTGPETTSFPFNCSKGSLELWKINGGVHIPILDSGFANKVVSWLTLKP